jgi:hypothetical protein
MSALKTQIRNAIEALALSPSVFKEIPDDKAEPIYRTALRHFVPKGEPQWWWEHFASATAADFPNGTTWKHLTELVPNPSELVWFIVADTSLPFYPVYEGTTAAIREVIAECSGFEYYIVHPELNWLLCENHHNKLIAVGAPVEERLREYAKSSVEPGHT